MNDTKHGGDHFIQLLLGYHFKSKEVTIRVFVGICADYQEEVDKVFPFSISFLGESNSVGLSQSSTCLIVVLLSVGGSITKQGYERN